MRQPDAIPQSEIHLHILDDRKITSPDQLIACKALLSSEEIEKYNQFRFPQHRHQYLVTRALIRTTLSRYHPGKHPAEWCFEVNDYGRPRITGMRPGCFAAPIFLDFNVSHTEGCIVLAVSGCESPGVDVEQYRPAKDLLTIAEQFFTTSELEHLQNQPQGLKHHHFFDLWTLKEAYIKATGMGLSCPLNSFEIDLRSNEPPNGRMTFRNQQSGDSPEMYWNF